MVFVSVVFVVVALTFSRRVFSSSPDGGNISEPPKNSKFSALATLFSEYQADQPLGENEHFWRGSPVPSREYFMQVDVSDIRKVISSFEECKENDALPEWENRMVSHSLVLAATLGNIADELDLVDVNTIEKTTLKEILKCWIRKGSCSQDLEKLLFSPPPTPTVVQRNIFTCILANEKCLFAIVVSLFKKTENPVRFITAIMPLLDYQTRSRFLRYLETALSIFGQPFDVSKWRHWRFLEEEQEAINSSADNLSIRHFLLTASLTLRRKLSEFLPIDPIPIEYSNLSLFDTKLITSAESSDTAMQIDEPTNFTNCYFEKYDVVWELLLRVDFHTLLHIVPCVNKLFNSIATKRFHMKRSQYLREHTNVHAQLFDPYRLSKMYPWNAVFKTPRELIEYHLAANRQTTDKRWLTAVLETMTENVDVDVEMLKVCFKHADLTVLLSSSHLPIFVSMGLLDVILQDEASFIGQLPKFSVESLFCLTKHVKDSTKLLKLIADNSDWIMACIINRIVFLDDLMMPEVILRVAEQYVLDKYNLSVTLPLSADRIVAIDTATISQMLAERYDAQVLIKVFNTFVDGDAIGNWNVNFWKPIVSKMTHHLLSKDTNAMTPTQFEALLEFASEAELMHCEKLMQSTVNRRRAKQLKSEKN